jgi:hypothetical protein
MIRVAGDLSGCRTVPFNIHRMARVELARFPVIQVADPVVILGSLGAAVSTALPGLLQGAAGLLHAFERDPTFQMHLTARLKRAFKTPLSG